MARLERRRVRLFSRRGHDWSDRFPPIGKALASLSVRSITIDGEAVALCPKTGLSLFDELHSGHRDGGVPLPFVCSRDRLDNIRAVGVWRSLYQDNG